MSYRLERQRLARQRMLDELLEDLSRAREDGAYWYTSSLQVARETRERCSRSVSSSDKEPQRLQGKERDILRFGTTEPAPSAELTGARKDMRRDPHLRGLDAPRTMRASDPERERP